MTPNRSRVRVVDAEANARQMRTTFTDKPVRGRVALPCSWPVTMQHVGDALAVAYASDKWKKDGDYELYKHLHDGKRPNRALCTPGFLHHFERQGDRYPVIGPLVSFAGVTMPRHFAVLGLFEEANLRLHVDGTDAKPRFGRGEDDGVVRIMVKRAMLGAGTMGDGEPFIFVYSEEQPAGIHMIIVGDELDIERDGIVG